MATLKLYLLGTPRFTLDKEEIGIGRKKALALLCYLAVKAEPQRRDTLAALLWPFQGNKSLRRRLEGHRPLRSPLGHRQADAPTWGIQNLGAALFFYWTLANSCITGVLFGVSRRSSLEC